jgi:hypothetical protein
MPWIAVSHIVTRRQIPFELAGCEAPTRDNVRARMDLLLTFVIGDPGRFVYAIAAPDFDLVMQAAGHDGVRAIFRALTSNTRAVVQFGQLSDVIRTALTRDGTRNGGE